MLKKEKIYCLFFCPNQRGLSSEITRNPQPSLPSKKILFPCFRLYILDSCDKVFAMPTLFVFEELFCAKLEDVVQFLFGHVCTLTA